MKNIGLARFSVKGPMEYLLTTGDWILDSNLYGAAPVLLFDSESMATEYAKQNLKSVRVSAVAFELDQAGKVVSL